LVLFLFISKELPVNEPIPSFFARVAIALRLFFRALSNPDFAARMARDETGTPAGKEPAKPAPAQPVFKEALPDSALQLLGLLQQEGRFIDFIEEDVSGFSDSDIGAAARIVHQGCRKAIRDHLKIAPIRPEPEGSSITLPEGFDASSVRLAGNVVGQPPYCGKIAHRGWRANEISLPKVAVGHDVRVLASAEVEL
jgi:hypothetical protein